ncbi:tripartite tricarboxylate transporter TctB family protein (plasmid) [Azospirillum baldaniorum]|uniref:Permease subunit n=1 Tax=Azospirillum baldaniorum TaxID=1064539 RepID=A0A9P1NQ31_9PROT|nr:tripartite tricarboxylate transporter TctB family protein [Azospirillum baldaniorum]TWA81971.1 tripartite tricarboxylate transporter TctB family protein [Azospirillum brasilense]AWJ94130.1 tripartite tricarboxylate transporter TctB family protein [Azospirillum baldaniorum]NUB07734.1 tripartite tricarboxylate transporter TctB family protein [Azospirillum baldaniorum]TWA58516.1 tripartite tricarboxylate transporter TctB family protein [Azospirillum baldaniorum]CCD01450.1 putative permease sub
MSHSSGGTPGSGTPRSADLFAGAVVAAVAVAAIVVSGGFPTMAGLDTDVGPARFPIIYAGALLVLSAILVIGRLLPKRGAPVAPAEPQAPAEAFRFHRVAIGVVATAVYIYMLSLIGYLPTTVVFLIGMMRLMGMRSWVRAPIIAVAVTAFLYLVFLYALQIPLPDGSLFETGEF